MAAGTKAKVRRLRSAETADQQIDPLTQKVLVIASEVLSGGSDPFKAVALPSGLDEHQPYLDALERYREAGRALARVAMENVLRNYEEDED